MQEIKIKNFIPQDTETMEDNGWTLEYEEGKFFKATCKSRDSRIACFYILTKDGESVENTKLNHYVESGYIVLNSRRKPIPDNNGNGIVRLSGGYVAKRFGFFRNQEFQDFLDNFNINSVRNVFDLGFDSTFLIFDSEEEKATRLLVPSNSKIAVIKNGKSIIWNLNRSSSNKSTEVVNKKDDLMIAHVKDAPFWIYEERTGYDRSILNRKLYIHGNTNAIAFKDQLNEIFAENNWVTV